jgi:acyl-CoA thioesterase
MDYTKRIQQTNEKNSFMRHNGILLTDMAQDYAKVEAHLDRENRNLYGAVHGGMFLTMADCAAGGASRSNGMRYVTVSNSFEFYHNTKDDHLIAEGRIKSRGRTIAVVEVEIHDGTGKLLCGGTFTMFCTGSLDEVPAD